MLQLVQGQVLAWADCCAEDVSYLLLVIQHSCQVFQIQQRLQPLQPKMAVGTFGYRQLPAADIFCCVCCWPTAEAQLCTAAPTASTGAKTVP